MKHLLFSLLRFAVVFLSSSIVFFALVVIAGHILTPYLNHRTQVIERFAANLLHRPVQISQFSVMWEGLMPVLAGRNVIIWNDTRTQALLEVKQLEVGIDLFKSLLTGHIKLGEVRGRGLELLIYQTKDNQFVLRGMNTLFNQASNAQSNSIDEVLGWLLAEPALSLQDVVLNFYPKIGPKWPEIQFNVILQNEQERHQLSAQLKFLEKRAENLRIIANLTTVSSQQSLPKISGRVYLEGHAILLARWLSLFIEKYSLQNGLANFKVWADWQQDHFTQVHALLENTENSVLQVETQPPITITPFSSDVRWELPAQGNWKIDATVRNLGFSSWQKIPGIKGLNAYCHITEKSGNLIAHSKNLELDFMKLFKEVIYLDNLSSELSWQHTKGEISIQIPKFDASNADLSVNAQMALLIPVNTRDSQASILAHIKTDQPARIAYYLPLPFMSKALIHWLDSAIIKGSGDGNLLLQGPLFEFPFDKNDGTFLIHTQIKNAELHYESAWPNLEKINANLIFAGRQMHILVDSAEIFGTHLEAIQANIPLIKKHVQAVLHIMVQGINTRLEHGLAFLEATPLMKKTGDRLSGLLLSGPLKLVLQFTIPFGFGKETLQVAGLGITEDAKVQILSHDIQIDNVKGQFFLSQAGIQAQNLLGVLWNKPIVISIRSVPSMQLSVNYNGMQTILNPEKNGWRFSVDNKMAQGSVLIPNDNQQAMEANFKSVILDSVTSSLDQEWNLKRIPKIDFHANDMRYKSMDFGMLELKLRPLVGGVAIRELQSGNAIYHLIASGAWHDQQNPSTDIMGQLDSPNLSSFLSSWGLPASITAEQTHIRFNLQWPGTPREIKLARLRGNFSFKASNGQIVDIGSSAEAKLSFGRLLTFLSLQSLGRRLQLDFSDLKAKGFDFTALQGNFTLNDGNAFTRDVTIEGPVAAIAITGRIGLVTKNYNLIIKIKPHFTSSLPVIVGLAGGPVAGAIAWVANAVLGSTVQKIAETTYHLTGSWGKPEVIKTSAQ
jgi:uncharacterized protein YhdP